MASRLFFTLLLITAALLLAGAGCAAEPSGAGTLSVLVKGPDGPLPGAKVVSNRQPAGQLKVTGITLGDGTVTFIAINVGRYTFYVSAAGYEQQEFSVDVAAGQTRSVEMIMVKTPG